MRRFSPHLVPIPLGDFGFLDKIPTPYILEIGSGTGDFAIDYAAKNPQDFLVAVEKTKNKFRKFIAKLEQSKVSLTNLYPCHANAVNLVTHFVKPHSLKICFIHYPNPYPKEAQANKRFHRMPFFSRLIDSMIPGGEIHFSTNLADQGKEIKSYLCEHWGLSLIRESRVSTGSRPLTAFEKKYLSRGEECWHLVFEVPSVSSS